MPYLHAGHLNLQDFIGLIRNLSWAQNALLMAFSPVHAYFNYFSFEESFLAMTDQGRIFSPEGELKWCRIGGKIRVVCLGNQSPPAGLVDHSSEMEGLRLEKSEFVLWGIRTELEDEWIEQEVPHRFSYPLSGGNFARGRVALVVENWLDSGGLARFSRYHSLKEIPGGE